MMYELFIHLDAEADIERLWSEKPEAASLITVQLEEIRGDQELLDCLTVQDFGKSETEPFHVTKWQEVYRQGIDLWRLKIWELEDRRIPYRIVYAYMRGERKYYVLGVVHRSFNYDPDHEISKRILTALDSL